MEQAFILAFFAFNKASALQNSLQEFLSPVGFSRPRWNHGLPSWHGSRLSSSATNDANEATSSKSTQPTFITDPMHVYIEDTDAYGVMYNANYIRSYERALHLSSIPAEDVEISSFDDGGSSCVLDHPGWYVTGVTSHKFKCSPPLGGEFVVRGQLVDRDEEREVETWSLEMTSSGADAPRKYNSAMFTISKPPSSHQLSMGYKAAPYPPPFPSPEGGGTREFSFTPFRDEFCIHLGSTHLPLRNVLNLFERARTMALGGPDVLRKMQEEDNLLWVVTSIDDLILVNLWNEKSGDEIDESDLVRCEPGKDVDVKISITSKRKGMIVECRQTLLVPLICTDDKGRVVRKRRRLAQGIVTLCAIDAVSRRPTSKLPAYVLDYLQGSAKS